MNEKLQKVLARAGIASRRTIEKWIEQGRITVNQNVAQLGQRVMSSDQISVDGKPVSIDIDTVSDVLIYHKRLGEICSENDPEGRMTVFSALPKDIKQRWIMVGRLDINTSGLLLFTTDGELANRLMHPKYEIEREYSVRVCGTVTPLMLANMRKNVELSDGPAHFEKVEHVKGDNVNSWYRVMIREGRKREVRRIWESQNLLVNRLVRIRYGCVSLPDDLPLGKHRRLTTLQKNELANLVGLTLS